MSITNRRAGLNLEVSMNIMKEAFLMAAIYYINFTHFGYDLEFHEDEAIDIAVGHFLSKARGEQKG